MKEIILPKSSTDTGGKPSSDDWEKFIIPDSMSQKEELKLYPDFINKLSEKIRDIEFKLIETGKEIKSYDEKLREQSSKNIQVIGIFSAILALLIIDVSIIKSVRYFLSAILLISGLTFSMIIFLSLVHIFFSPEEKNKITKKYFWIPFAGLGILICIGILAYFKQWF